MLDVLPIAKLLTLSTFAFIFALSWTPFLTNFLFKYRLGKNIRSAESAPMYAELHKGKAGVPTMGGVLMWVTAALMAFGFALAADLFPANAALQALNFLSRGETWLPIFSLVVAGFIGMADDLFNIKKIGTHGGGIDIRHRLLMYAFVAAIGAWWFYVKLGFDTLHVPFYGDVFIGAWYVPFFMLVITATSFAVNETDGLDGLAGGTLATSFAAYAIICLLQGNYDLAALCGVIVGSLLAFLWFNIHPARFFMGDTGAMSMGVTLGIVAMLTNTAFILPIIGVVFVAEAASALLQIASKKILKRKIFRIAPVHHHFEAIGWPREKVAMRYWVLGFVFAIIGMLLAIAL